MTLPPGNTTVPAGNTASSDPDQIRREIELTQAALSNDVDTLTEKVSPGRIVERRVGRIRGRVQGLKDRVMGSDNGPYPARSRSGGGIGDTAQQVVGSVAGTASAAGTAVSDAATGTVEAVQEAPQAIRHHTQGNPLAAGIIAFGAGWLISSLLPASRQEQELAEQAKDRATELGRPIAEAATQAVTEMRDNLAEPAQQAVESVRSTAVDAGQTVTEQSRGAAEQVHSDATDAAEHVQRTASQP